MEPVVFLLVLVALVALYVLGRIRRDRRRAAIHAFASRAGLAFAPRDVHGTINLPFELFREGDERGIENVCAGTVSDLPVRLFDYWYAEESTDANGRRSRSITRRTCALTPLTGVWCPRLVVAPETLLTRVATAVGFRDIEFESEEFNRTFRVRANDERFAHALLDGQLMAWLMEGGPGARYEVIADGLLVSAPRLRTDRLWDLLTLTRGFRDRVPSVLASLYPPDAGGSGSLFEARFWLPALASSREDSGWFPRWTL